MLAINYLALDPFRAFGGASVFNNQRGRFVTFRQFMDKYHAKFFDEGLENVLDATNLIFDEQVPQQLQKDF